MGDGKKTRQTEQTDAPDAEHGEFQRLLERAECGSEEAIRHLVETYAPHVIRAVRRKLSKAIRAKFDSIDFAQAVWASFFASADRLTQFHQPEELVRYLAVMARNKVIDEIRRRMATDRYNVNRERSLDDTTARFASRLTTSEPSPSEVAVGNELWARLLQGCPQHHRRILELRRAGWTCEQIAGRVGVNERTVRRVIKQTMEEQRL